MNSLLRMTLLTLKPQDAEMGAGLLLTLGISTWEERKKGRLLEFRIPVPRSIKSALWLKKIEKLQRFLDRDIFQNVEIETLRDLDWQKAYQKYLKPFDLALPPHTFETPIKIIPHQGKLLQPAGPFLRIQAELAFGTGAHPSTQLASYFLQKILFHEPPASVLDAGCGTGILSMVAKIRGASEVCGVDTDPEAIKIARRNFKINKLKDIKLASHWTEVRSKYHIVVANMIQSEIVGLKRALLKRIKKRGYLILSGLNYKDVPIIRKEFSSLNFTERKNLRGWASLKFQNSKN